MLRQRCLLSLHAPAAVASTSADMAGAGAGAAESADDGVEEIATSPDGSPPADGQQLDGDIMAALSGGDLPNQ